MPLNGKRDFEAGAGYVVASGHGPFGRPHFLRQRGQGTVEELGRLGGFGAADLAPDVSVDLALLLPKPSTEGLLSTAP